MTFHHAYIYLTREMPHRCD